MRATKILCLFALLFWFFIPAVASAFECSKAAKALEFLICQNPDVNKQDDEMAKLYYKLTAKKIALNPTQPLWLRKQRDLCPDINCLRSVYASRIEYFNSLLAQQPPSPPKPVAAPSYTPVPPDFAEAAESAQTIIQAQPAPVPEKPAEAVVKPQPVPEVKPAPVVPPVTPPTQSEKPSVATTPVDQPKTIELNKMPEKPDPKPETKPAPPEEHPWLEAVENIKSLFHWIVLLAVLFGLYKAYRLPATQNFLKSCFAKFQSEGERVSANRRSSLRFWIVKLPLVIITGWLLFSVASYVWELLPKPEIDCSRQIRDLQFLPQYDYNSRLIDRLGQFYEQHPECNPENQNKTFANSGFLICYDIWALLAVLYLDFKLLWRKTPITRQNITRFCFAVSMVFGRISLIMPWKLLSFLSPLVPPNIFIGILLAGPLPPLALIVLGTFSVTTILGLIFSLISLFALPVIALFNQINIFLITKQRQELQTTGVYIWMVQFQHWLTNTPMPPAPPDDSKGARFATPEEIAAMIAPPSFEQGGTNL